MSATGQDLSTQLAQWLQATDIAELELTGPDRRLRLQRTAGDHITVEVAAPGPARHAQAAAAQGKPRTAIRAGSVGVVLLAHPLREEPLVRVGQSVSAGQAVALLRVGQVILPVPAPCDGKVTRILASDQAVAGYGTPLVEIE